MVRETGFHDFPSRRSILVGYNTLRIIGRASFGLHSKRPGCHCFHRCTYSHACTVPSRCYLASFALFHRLVLSVSFLFSFVLFFSFFFSSISMLSMTFAWFVLPPLFGFIRSSRLCSSPESFFLSFSYSCPSFLFSSRFARRSSSPTR